jgi:hypothetical protein
MKKSIIISLVGFLFLVIACSENQNSKVLVNPNSSSSVKNSTSVAKKTCNLIAYADTLYYLQNFKDDLKINPLVRGKGEYGAIPEGLEINESTGEINLTKSETGLKYAVFFVPEKTTDTCFTKLSISGIDYSSKIYILDKNEKLAVPIYNNNPNLLIPGSNSGKTEFDDGSDDDNGDGTLDEPLAGNEVIPQGLDISKLDGKIKLDKSLENGIFGKSPKSGVTKKFKLYYRIDDNSKKSLNKIELEFHYYDKVSEVPKSLKDKISENQGSFLGNNYGSKNARFLRIFRKPRPPQIVIVGRNA